MFYSSKSISVEINRKTVYGFDTVTSHIVNVARHSYKHSLYVETAMGLIGQCLWKRRNLKCIEKKAATS